MDFSVGQRVKFRNDANERWTKGFITDNRSNRKVSIRTDQDVKIDVSVGKVSSSVKDEVLVLEAHLDKDWRSDRHQGTFLKEVLKVYGITRPYAQVHSRSDLEKFLDRARRSPSIRFIHLGSHGTRGKGTRLHLTHETVDLVEDAEIFRDLPGRIIIFSCCDIGADYRAMERLCKVSGAQAVIAYRKPVTDQYANLAEHLLYDRFLKTSDPPSKIVKEVGEALDRLGIKLEEDPHRGHILRCFPR